MKALYQSIHVDAIGDSVSRMLQDLPGSLEPPRHLVEQAKELDKHYNLSRYLHLPRGRRMRGILAFRTLRDSSCSHILHSLKMSMVFGRMVDVAYGLCVMPCDNFA